MKLYKYRKFKRIQIEHHYGYKKLKEKLEDARFTVTYSEPVKVFNKKMQQNMVMGYICKIGFVKNYIYKTCDRCKK